MKDGVILKVLSSSQGMLREAFASQFGIFSEVILEVKRSVPKVSGASCLQSSKFFDSLKEYLKAEVSERRRRRDVVGFIIIICGFEGEVEG